MSKSIKAFVLRDDFIMPSNRDVSPLFELSEVSETFSKNKEVLHPTEFNDHSIVSFGVTLGNTLTDAEANAIVRVVKEFTEHATGDPFSNKTQLVSSFMSRFNSLFPLIPVSNFNYSDKVSTPRVTTADYLSFTILDVACNIWLAEETFNTFYPGYEIVCTLPLVNFKATINNTQDTLNELAAFSPIELNERLEASKDNLPSTYTRILNIPYRVPGTELERPCYFGFNIYGRHGNYSHVLRLELYRHLTEDLGLDGAMVEERFPSILEINEFFIIPRWDRVALPMHVGQAGINSQMTRTFSELVDLGKYVRTTSDDIFFRNNTTNLPNTYNNILLNVVNGVYSQPLVKDFAAYYRDLITVSTTHPDFDRMSTRSQRFLVLLENMLGVSDAASQNELFNRVIANQDYRFNIVDRMGVTYLSFFYADHQYYLIPKYEYTTRT